MTKMIAAAVLAMFATTSFVYAADEMKKDDKKGEMKKDEKKGEMKKDDKKGEMKKDDKK